MIYEMRKYQIERGRIPDIHDRMARHLPDLLARHGIRVVGRWTALAGPGLPVFVYVMEWRDFAEREACWGSFYADPDWARVRAETNAGSEMVEATELTFLRPNPAFQQVDADLDRGLGGVHQIVTQRILVGRNSEISAFLTETYLPRLRDAGAHVIGVCDTVSGPSMPNLVMFLAWRDESAWWDGWRALHDDTRLRDALAAQRETHGTTLFGTADTFLLEPAPYALPRASLRTRPPE